MSDAIRAKIFDQLKKSPRRVRKQIYDFMGVEVELRSLSLESAERLGVFDEGKTSTQEQVWKAALESVYAPGTDVLVFVDSPEQRTEFRQFPIDEINNLLRAILDVSGLNKEAQAETGKV